LSINKIKKSRKGFSIIEILIYIAIGVVLITSVTPCISMFNRIKLNMAASELAHNIRTAQIMAINEQKDYTIQILQTYKEDGQVVYLLFHDIRNVKEKFYLPKGIEVKEGVFFDGKANITYHSNGNTGIATTIRLSNGKAIVEITINPCVGRAKILN
jgi:type II secretory pathway pseudopilin PulG